MHLVQIAVEIPVVVVFLLYLLPLVVLLVIVEVVKCGVAVECGTEYLSLGVKLLDSLSHLDGLAAQLLDGNRLGMHPAVGIVPENRLVVKAVALYACCGL